MPSSARKLSPLIIAVALLTGGVARAEDLDGDKSGAQLFAANCTACHHSPKGLAKNRISLTLWYFLQQHYTTSMGSATKLTAYLESADTPSAKPQRAAHNVRSAPASAAAARAPRPPMPVPVQ